MSKDDLTGMFWIFMVAIMFIAIGAIGLMLFPA